MSKSKIDKEEFKYLIDSRMDDAKQQASEEQTLFEARLKSYRKINSEEKMIMQLYRLKLLLEKELQTEELQLGFHAYSSTYVDLLYKTRKSFASDINFSETQLSLILSGKRPATEEFVSKIKTHSDHIFEKFNISFNTINWFKIFHLDRLHNYMHNNTIEDVSFDRMKRFRKE